MEYMYDTEFIEDGKTIDLISIGIVAEDGREFYAVSTEFDTRKVAKHDWLMKNVMPYIKHDKFVVADFLGAPVVRDIYVTDPAAMPREEIALGILNFVSGDKDIQWWNWYGAYDHVALCQLFGAMIDLPPDFPMWSNDIKQVHKAAGYPPMPKQPDNLHNALEDAKFNRVRLDYLRKLLAV